MPRENQREYHASHICTSAKGIANLSGQAKVREIGTLNGGVANRMSHSELAESEPGNHSLDVLRRLEILREMEIELQGSDNFNQLPNVLALLQAYRGGMLDWNIGLVTYWFEGVQLCEPRPFSWDEFEVLNAHHSGKTGFWMEGVSCL